MLDKEKDLRINELLKRVTTISKKMPEIVFTYFVNFEKSKSIKPFYNLFAESLLSLFSLSFLNPILNNLFFFSSFSLNL